MKTEVFRDVATFAKEMMRSRDIDPIYDVLAELYRTEFTGQPETQLWFTALYLGYYNLTSALAAFRLHPTPGHLHQHCQVYPCSTERRNLRGGKITQHIESYLNFFVLPMAIYGNNGSPQSTLIQAGWGSPLKQPEECYEIFWGTAQQVWGNGRWAAFKWSEILKKVHGFNLAAPDMRMQFCSGPKEGLEWLYDCEGASVMELNARGADMMTRLHSLGVDCGDWETLETVCCNFNSLRKGKYYIGHDIDEFQEQIGKSTLCRHDKDLLYGCRERALPRAYLGEHNGWHGIRKPLMRQYADNGLIAMTVGDWMKGK